MTRSRLKKIRVAKELRRKNRMMQSDSWDNLGLKGVLEQSGINPLSYYNRMLKRQK